MVTTDLDKFDDYLKNKFSDIKTRTLIIWGKNDAMLHFSGAKYLNECIVNSEIKIMEECGHALQLDQPKKTTEHLIDFFNKNF